jgi:hypothetical protein
MKWAPALLLLAACGAASVRSTQFRGPDGSTNWWSISCRADNALCLREAGEVCPHGYVMVDRTSHNDAEAKTVVVGGGYAPVIANSSATAITNGEMTLRCRGQSIAHQPGEPQCDLPENLRVGSWCMDDRDPKRRFLSEDPREDAGVE